MAPHEKIPVRRQGSKQACANEKFQKREKLARQGNKIHLHVQRGASEKSQPLVWRAVHARMQTFSATSLVSWAPTLHAADRYSPLAAHASETSTPIRKQYKYSPLAATDFVTPSFIMPGADLSKHMA